MRITGREDDKEADSALPDAETQKTKINLKHPKLFMASEGEDRVDGLEINQDPLPVMGTDGSRNLG
jgi:hypothetical protein